MKGENEVMDGTANAQESEVNSDESLEAKYIDVKLRIMRLKKPLALPLMKL